MKDHTESIAAAGEEAAASNVFNSQAYKTSRWAYIAECTIGYLITILVSDAYLAKLLKSVGLEDSQIGIISSLISLAFLVQLFSISMVRHIRNTKGCVILFLTLGSLLFGFTFLLPFLPFSLPVKSLLVYVCILGGYIFKHLVQNLYYRWGNSFVHPGARGSFSATKEIISLIVGIVFTFCAGWMFDRFENAGNLNGGLIVIAITILVLTIMDFVSLVMIKNEKQEDTSAQKKSTKEILHATFGNKAFNAMLISQCGFEFARYFSMGFMGTYKTEELMLTVGTVQVINIAGNVGRILLSKKFGRYADKTSFARAYCVALLVMSLSFLCSVFTMPSTWWLIIGTTVLFNVGMAGVNANLTNMCYSYVDIEYFSHATSIKYSISGLVGFLASLVGSRILKAVQENGNHVFGLQIYGQQLLSFVSFVCILLVTWYSFKVLAKQKVQKR